MKASGLCRSLFPHPSKTILSPGTSKAALRKTLKRSRRISPALESNFMRGSLRAAPHLMQRETSPASGIVHDRLRSILNKNKSDEPK
jgi:hypothetical protein